MREQNHYVYAFGPFHLDATRRVLLKEGQPLKLFPKQFDTLLALVEHSGELLEKDELMRQVWPDAIVEESNLTTNVSHLRKLLGEDRNNHDYIVTVPGRGYRFVAGVKQAFDEVVVHERTRVTVESEEQTDVERIAECGAVVVRGNGQGETNPNAVTVAKPQNASTRHIPWIWFGVLGGIVFLAIAAVVVSRFARQSTPAAPFQNVALKQLTTKSKTVFSSLSADGKLFAYVSRDAGKESLWLGHVGGGELVALRHPDEVTYRSVSFSSDGVSLYYVIVSDEYSQGTLFRIPVLGGVPEKLRDDIAVKVAFAADTKRFAYVRPDAERKVSSLMIANTDGHDQRELISRPEHLAFRTRSPSWSIDGTKIAVGAVSEGGSYEIFVVSVANGEIKPLTSFAWERIDATVWLPDGRGLIAVAKEKGAWDSIQLWHISYPKGEAHRVVSDLDNYGAEVSISSDGQLLLATQDQRITNVWVAPAQKLNEAKQITVSAIGRRDGWNNLDWTPDNRLLYGAIVRDSLTIWTMGADGNNQKQLTSAGHMDQFVSSTGDGRYIVFESNRSGNAEIWRANANGDNLTQLTNGGGIRPHVSLDGKWLVYESRRDGRRGIWRVSIEGGEPVRLFEQFGFWPRISPDGKLIAIGYEPELNSTKPKLGVISSDGGKLIRVFEVPRLANFNYGIRWTPDGKAVTYRDWAKGIWRQSLDGGEPTRLEGLPEEKIYAYDWSRDGKQFVFVRGAEIREVVLLQNNK